MWDASVDDEERGKFADENLEDLRRADVLLLLNPAGGRRLGHGGRDVELGYALALEKTILLVGGRENVFHYLDRISVISGAEHEVAEIVRALGARLR
jgi:hypothetical protein